MNQRRYCFERTETGETINAEVDVVMIVIETNNSSRFRPVEIMKVIVKEKM